MLTKDEKIAKLQRQLEQITQLKADPQRSPEFEKWHRDTVLAIRHCSERGSPSVQEFLNIGFGDWADFDSREERKKRVLSGYAHAETLLRSMIDEIIEYHQDSPLTEVQPQFRDAFARVVRICEQFPRVVCVMNLRHDKREPLRMVDEYDVQYLLSGLLAVDFEDVRPEEYTPSVAGSSSRIDFLLKREKIAIEVKKTRENLGPKEIREQLILDIKNYPAHPGCEALLCFVYDPDRRITNIKGFEDDLSENRDDLVVRVLVVA